MIYFYYPFFNILYLLTLWIGVSERRFIVRLVRIFFSLTDFMYVIMVKMLFHMYKHRETLVSNYFCLNSTFIEILNKTLAASNKGAATAVNILNTANEAHCAANIAPARRTIRASPISAIRYSIC